MRFALSLVVLVAAYAGLMATDHHRHRAASAWLSGCSACSCADCRSTGSACEQGQCAAKTTSSPLSEAPKPVETVTPASVSYSSCGSCSNGTCSQPGGLITRGRRDH